MPPIKKIQQISPQDIVQILNRRFIFLMPSFYETQSAFLSAVYKKYKNIETANIVLCFARNMHLQILRQRENNLNFDVSLKNFWINFNHISKPEEKISSIVNITGIPKETTRRKIKNLLNSGIISNGSNKKCYIWNFTSKDKELYVKNVNEQISYLARFIAKFSGSLNLSLNMKIIEEELRSQFSFYWYHFLSSQLIWLRMWQSKLKDNDLLLISLQATIPTLQFAEKHSGDFNVDNIFKIIGKTRTDINFVEAAVSATTVSEVTGIPRERGAVSGVETSRGRIRATKVGVVAAGHSSVIGSMAGLRLPIESHPLQALVSEPLKPVLHTVVMSNAVHGYISQSDKGELVIGAGVDSYVGYGQRGSFSIIEGNIGAIVELFPVFSRVRMLRQWGGIVDVCPDACPIIGKTPIRGLYFNCGWGTGGFKATPGSGWVFAHTIARDEPHSLNAAFTLERFQTGALIDEHGAAGVAH